ncbi:MAG: adenylate/guanylate cyclase domain-containing protein [Magnetococcales bacterium]|nr:adenylate/guanylate cyclase domain-containing protein [Magnetococcales bacterium]
MSGKVHSTDWRSNRADEIHSQVQAVITRMLQDSLQSLSLEAYLDETLFLILSIPWVNLNSAGIIHLYEPETGELLLVAQQDLPDSIAHLTRRLHATESYCHQAISTRKIDFICPDSPESRTLFKGVSSCGYYVVPILSEESVQGVLTLFFQSDCLPDQTTESFLRAMTLTLGDIIRRRLNEERLAHAKDASEVFNMLLESAMEPVPLQDQLDQVLTMLFYLPWLPIQPKGTISLTRDDQSGMVVRSYTKNVESYLDHSGTHPLGQCLCGAPLPNQLAFHGTQVDGGGDHQLTDLNSVHCAVPIMEGDQMAGLMVLYLDGATNLKVDNRLFLQSVASVLSIIIVRKRLDQQLVQALEEQKQANDKLDRANTFIRKTFGSYMSEEVVETILDTPDGLLMGGEEKRVTVLMTDLRGFTALSGRMPPGEVLTMLNLYLGEMTRIITQYKGTIIEFLGDGILTLFGAPITREDDAQRAVACALAMQESMSLVNQRNREEGFPELTMGAGVNTGMVIAGNIGSDVRRKYGVVGQAINLAARIESLTVGGQVLISDRCAQACHEPLHFKKQWSEKFKGVAHPVILFDVAGIGGEDGIHLSAAQPVSLQPVTEPLSVVVREVVGKQICQDERPMSRITALAMPLIEMESSIRVPLYTNLNIIFFDAEGRELSNQLYGKVLATDARRQSVQVYLTSLPPEVEKLLRRIEKRDRSC